MFSIPEPVIGIFTSSQRAFARVSGTIVASALIGVLYLFPIQAQADECTGSLADGPLSLENNSAVAIRLGDRRLKIPWRFLNEAPFPADRLCKLGGDRFSAQFWFPGLLPTEKQFWYYREQFVKGWSAEQDPRKQGVIKLVSVETYDENRLKRNSAGNSIRNILRLYDGPNLRLVDEHGLNKIVSPEPGMANRYWFRKGARQDVFLDCNEEKGVGYCTGFVDLKDLALSVRYHFSYPLVSRNDEVVAGIHQLLGDWLQ